MASKQQLDILQSASIKGADPNTLSDISAVKIEGETPAQRLDSFLSQVANPYCFRVGNTPVRVSFSSKDKTLKSLILRHFWGLKH